MKNDGTEPKRARRKLSLSKETVRVLTSGAALPNREGREENATQECDASAVQCAPGQTTPNCQSVHCGCSG
jgi:hypothetical protein